jgi:DNA-binding transcriptional regulator LsrR (DeoR family)
MVEVKKSEPTPKVLADVARDYYLNDKKQSAIAQKHGVNQSTIAHWITRAWEQGVISIDIDPEFALAGSEHRALSRRLSDAFGLNQCIVIDPGGTCIDDDPKCDKLHTVLTNTAGTALKEWIQSNDHIVVGGGRAPMRVARFIRRMTPHRRAIRISPLSGRIWTGSWQVNSTDNLERPLDADDAARLLALAYEHEAGTRFSQIGHPLYALQSKVAKRIIKEQCVFSPGGSWKTEWGFQAPNRALVGVGALHPSSGHRISELLINIDKNPSAKMANYLVWASAKFRDAMDFAKSHGLPPFGDLANRLFPALPLPRNLDVDRLPSAKDYDRLRKLLDVLNDHAIVMEWEHLRRIPFVWAVAGGEVKVDVIWTLLISKYLESDRTRGLIKELTIDLATAETLEQALEDFYAGPPAIRNWYAKICPRIFG